jgi:hypothetical protein
MSEATITNTLLRCTREDDLAKGCFELVRHDLGLWVFELPVTFQEIFGTVAAERTLLSSLSSGVSDYALHLAASVDEVHRLRIPREIAALSADCGFLIEVIGSPT